MITEFLSLNNSESELIINRSRFLGFSFYVEDDCDALNKVNELKIRFADATHVCYAFIADPNANYIRFCDDGEPSGTAGIPILDAIKGRKLTKTLVAVVRYFGGIKLGKGGLARAYGDTASQVLDKSPKIRFIFCNVVRFNCSFLNYKRIQNGIKEGIILSTEFSDEVTLTAAFKHEFNYVQLINSLCQAQTNTELIETKYIRI